MAHYWCSAQPSLFYHILINFEEIMFHCFNNSMISLMCMTVVAESCLLLSEKNDWKISWHMRDSGVDTIPFYVVALKCSNSTPRIDKNLFSPYYSDWIWCEKLATTLSKYSRQHNISWNDPQNLNASCRVLPQWWAPIMHINSRQSVNYCIDVM